MVDTATPEQAVDALCALYAEAVAAQRAALERFQAEGIPPTPEQRAQFRYPELRVAHRGPRAGAGRSARAYGQLTSPGDYAISVTQPEFFRPYLTEQLRYLVDDHDAALSVGVGATEMPYAFILEDAAGPEAAAPVNAQAAALARHFPYPRLAAVGDAIVDGELELSPEDERPLALFDAPRVDYSLKRLRHYTGAPWRDVQPWILFTNYQRYVEEFVRWAVAEAAGRPGWAVSCPGGVRVDAATPNPVETALSAPWRKFQMPAYHLLTPERNGVSLVNIGVGPSNAKNICDHLAVLRPHCWIMVGHCGGLRHTQRIGDYVLAHAYARRDKVLDDDVPLDIPIPAIAEVQIALQKAAETVSGEGGEALKRRLRTGTVVSYADRNWELNYRKERRYLSQSRAVAVDMESATIAAQGFRLRVPYGVLLCVSDKPLHGEIKLPGAADQFYERAIAGHLQIGIEAVAALRQNVAQLHSRKLRSFDEPPFR